MGLVNKLKSILFEEEEVEIPVLEKKEKSMVSVPPVIEKPKEEPVKANVDYRDFYQEEQKTLPKREVTPSKPVQSLDRTPEVRSERPIIQKETSFSFPDFDEEEFESALPRRTTNVLEHERKKEIKKKEYAVPPKKQEPQEVKTKFRPSPIISPVYGILDKNYTPDDITTRVENETPKVLDVDSVRKKAFGTLELDEKIDVPDKQDFDDQVLEERLEKARTIDELLKDSSDDVIDIAPEEEIKNDPLDETIESLEEKNEEHEKIAEEDESLESDLFDLIDSMYENREDGE